MLLLRQRCVQCVSVAPHALDHLKGGIPPCWNILHEWLLNLSKGGLLDIQLVWVGRTVFEMSDHFTALGQCTIKTTFPKWHYNSSLYNMRNTGQMLEWQYPPCCHHIRSAVCSNSAIPHWLATSRNCLAHASAKWRSSVFITPKGQTK